MGHQTLRFYRRNLPHWLVADATYFVTIRLKGTLPRDVIQELAEARAVLVDADPADKRRLDLQRQEFARIEQILDACSHDRAWLADARVAELVMKSLPWFAARGWDVYAGTLMPNHLHLLLRSSNGRSGMLLSDLSKFKGFTAREGNRVLGRSGTFWAREDFDHWLRDRFKFDATVRYILHNPVKAGLVATWRDWPWTYVKAGLDALGDSDAASS